MCANSSLFPEPRSVTELQRFIGAVNYYRCYIEGLSKIAEPLYNLLRKGKHWSWDERCHAAFDELRTRLIREPVCLSHPDWKGEFHIEADASSTGVAAVLSQMDHDTNKLRPVQFFSSALNPSQKNYSAGQLEAWALVAARRKWSVYLKGAPSIVLITDHCPLKWLKEQKDPKHTYARWLMELQELPFRIGFRPGRENQVADYLSRIQGLHYDETINQEDLFEDKVFSTRNGEQLYDRLTKEQTQEAALQRAIAELSQQGRVLSGQLKKVSHKLRRVNGNLFFENRIVIPKHLRQEAIEASHAQHHLGQAGTLRTLRRNFFWPRMGRDVRVHCQGCIVCQRAKRKVTAQEPMYPMSIGKGTPGEAVAMDIGTLPWSDDPDQGYRYVLLMVDLFTRNVELQPLKDQETETLLTAFQQGWVYRGHGMPAIVLTDQGSNIDGNTFREFCERAGVAKRHTTPYHPQGDGMAEKNIGLVKQVIRCLLMDRKLLKGSWPRLLGEVSFHINAMENATSRLSPHLLTFGREPLSPLDAWCEHMRPGEANTHGEYLEELRRKKVELENIARENIDANLTKARSRYNAGKTVSNIENGDKVMVRRNKTQDSLSPRFDGPFEVLQRRGPDVRLRLRSKDKWIHLNNVKKYVGPEPAMVPVTQMTAAAGEEPQPQESEMELAEGELQAGTEEFGSDEAGNTANAAERRYPDRYRRAPKHFTEYVPWGASSEESGSDSESEVGPALF